MWYSHRSFLVGLDMSRCKSGRDALTWPSVRRPVSDLTDFPGLVDLSSKVAAVLRVTGGAMVVVDCIEGGAVQTETVLRCTARDSKFVREQGGSLYPRIPDDTWRHVQSTHERNKNVNVITALLYDAQVGLERAVAFGSGLHGWCFNAERFAKIYASEVEDEKMVERLWRDIFFNAEK